MTDIKIYGRVFIATDIEAVTGLHIGGSSEGLEIGGVDNAVIRNQLTNRPYIPGSSLKGKMRSQTEKIKGLTQNTKIGKIKIHACKSMEHYENCAVCPVFGVSAAEEKTLGQTRLVVRDATLSEKSAEKLQKAKTDMPYTEVKTEVAIDRVTSAASPRNLERVPAGTVFDGAELVFTIFEKKDFDRLEIVFDALQLVEDDYLGGSGSRGSGKVRFKIVNIYARNNEHYSEKIPFFSKDNNNPKTVQEISDQFDEIKTWLKENIPFRQEDK